jgi:signal transduction histidine kinase
MTEHSAAEPAADASRVSEPAASFSRGAPVSRDVATAALARGLATALRYIGPVALIVALLAALETVLRSGMPESVLPLLVWWGPAFIAVVVLAIRPRAVTATLVLVVGVVAGAGWTATVLGLASMVPDRGLYLVEAVPYVLIFIGAVRPTPTNGLVWVTFGFVAGSIALGLGYALAEVPLAFSQDRIIDALIIAGAYVAIAAGQHRRRDRVPRLPDAARASRELADARQRERAASALVHDTVLASLTMIERSSGAMDPRLGAGIRADLSALTLARASAVGVVSSGAAEGSLAARVMSVVEGFRWRGLRVDVTGLDAIDAVLGSPAPHTDALMRAMAAALDNVHLHAGTDRADVTIGCTARAMTAMVVDAGPGFDPNDVPADRLGVRDSIRARVESVGGTARVWSSDSGTTVLLSVPFDGGSS